MSPRPDVSAFAEELYTHQHMFNASDEAQGWSLLTFNEAFSTPFSDVDNLVRDDPDTGAAGWTALYDPDRCPAAYLGYLAQFVGVRLLPGLSDAQQRERVKSTDGFRRGTVGAIRGAAQQFLIGDKTVVLRERYDPSNATVDSPYHLQVVTFLDETPDPARVLAAVMAQKPAGIILHYDGTATGQDWQTIVDNGETWNNLKTNYDDWADVAGTY